MANSETTFGDRLARGYLLNDAIAQMVGYNPADTDIKTADYKQFLNDVDLKNTTLAGIKTEWQNAVKARQELYFNDTGVKKRTSYVLAYCKSRSDIKKETVVIERICRLILNYRKPKPPKIEKAADDTQTSKKRNLGEQSFGDLVKLLGDLLEALKQLPLYEPPNTLIKLDELTNFRNSLLDSNTVVGDKIYEYLVITKERLIMYEQLKDKMLRIKATVKAQYGINSNEYQSIKGIRV